MQTFMQRPVRVTSVCLQPRSREEDYSEEMIAEVVRAAQKGMDLIVTPEIWTKDVAESRDGTYFSPVLDCLKKVARQHRTYIVALMRRHASEEEVIKACSNRETDLYASVKAPVFNSAILIDRQGEAVFSYDKVFPVFAETYSAELYKTPFSDMLKTAPKENSAIPGDHIGVYPCDFGKLGFAICFDINFPELFRQMALAGAELVVWSAAYSGGRQASMLAGLFNYYIVTCSAKTLIGDCRICDITGEELLIHYPKQEQLVYSTSATLDLDRMLFHKDYNEGLIEAALRKHAGEIEADYRFAKEGWIVLRSTSPKTSVADVVRAYGLTPLREYKFGKCVEYLRILRGRDIDWMQSNGSQKKKQGAQ